MKYIRKGAAPRSYSDWCQRVQGTDKEDFGEIPANVKTSLVDGLLSEQGWLCAYTMRRVEVHSVHIEHVKPVSVCRQERRGADLDYGNIIGCFPREGMELQFRYGAQAKEDWWNESLFVSPLHHACEQRFRFNLLGEIAPASGDAASAETCRRLVLDHASLTEDRKRVIDEFIYGGDGPLSEAEAQRWISGVTERKKDGRFFQFCVAIRHALEDHMNNLEKHRQRRAFAKKPKA